MYRRANADCAQKPNGLGYWRKFSMMSLLLVLSVVVVCLMPVEEAQAQRKYINFRTPNLVWYQVNLYRSQKGVPGLTADKRLNAAAQAYAVFLAEHNRRDGAPTIHTADGRDPTARARAQGYQCAVVENVAAQWASPPSDQASATRRAMSRALDWWKHSPPHEAAMRDPNFKYTGLGVAAWIHGNEEIYHFVQLFSRDCPNPQPAWIPQ
jgi:hypothetical protein